MNARLRRYALYIAVWSVMTIVTAYTAVTIHYVIFLVASVPVLLAWGPFFTHLQLYGAPEDLWRWRVSFFLFPPAMTLYWWLYVSDP